MIQEVRDAKGRTRNGKHPERPRRIPTDWIVTFNDREHDQAGVEVVDILAGDDLDRALARLPERDRMIVVLRYYEDLSQREIGELLAISEGRVSQILSRALTHLRSHLADDHCPTSG